MHQTKSNELWLQKKANVAILALIGCLLWGSAFPGIKIGFAQFSIDQNDVGSLLLFAGYRFFLAGVILLIYLIIKGKKVFSLHRQDYVRIGILGLMMTTCQYIFFYIALAHISGVTGAILISTNIFFYVILGSLLLKSEHMNKFIALGCCIGFIGVIVANMGSSPSSLGFSFMGEGFMIIAAIVQAFAGIYGKTLSKTVDPAVMTSWQLIIGSTVLIILGLILGGEIHGFTIASTAVFAYLALLSAVAFVILAVLLKHNSVSSVTVYQFSIPIFGAVLSSIFVGEKLFDFKYLVSLACVSLGIYLVCSLGAKNNKPSTPK